MFVVRKAAFCVIVACLFSVTFSASFGQELNRRDDILQGAFYCKNFSDALYIATQEEESLALGETDDQYRDRIFFLISLRRCTVDPLRYGEMETICQWSGIVDEHSHEIGPKRIVKVFEKNLKTPVYILIAGEKVSQNPQKGSSKCRDL